MTIVTLSIPNLPLMPAPDLSWIDALPPEALRVLQQALHTAAPRVAEDHNQQVELWALREHCPLLEVMLNEYRSLMLVATYHRVMDRASELGLDGEPDAVQAWAQACQRHYEVKQ